MSSRAKPIVLLIYFKVGFKFSTKTLIKNFIIVHIL